MNEFIKQFTERGYLHQATDLEVLTNYPKKIIAYLGFDCTANSLHIGSLVQIMILRLLQKTGNKPVILMGGGTTKIGDPSGRDETRKLLTGDDIEANKAGIKKNFERFITFGDGDTDAIFVDNNEWLSGLNYIEFLRDYGKHFSVNRMLAFDSVKLRLEREQNLSFLEFNYMLLQAYDFVYLHNKHNCMLQIGGSDQWGNIVSGVELNRRLGGEPIFGITTPLITTSSGAKMGKSLGGAVWLSEDLISTYEYFQYWRNVADDDVIRFLKLFTDLPISEIDKLALLQGSEINEAKKILAYEATKLCHGEEAADAALTSSIKTFEEGEIGGALPEIEISKSALTELTLFQALVAAGLADSNSEAKRLIKGKGVRINDEAANDELLKLNISYLKDGIIKLSAGKKKHVIIRVN